MNPFKRPIRPAYLILALCLLLFAWKTSQLTSMHRELESALHELQPGKPLTLDLFIRDYLSDPFGKAIGLSQRQLQLAQQISARVPGYESATAWRGDALGIAFITVLYLLFMRFRSRLPLEHWRGAIRAWVQRLALRMAPLIAEARRRTEEQRRGRPSGGFGQSSRTGAASGTVYDVVACPSCGQKLRLPSGKGALRVKCSGCGAQFEART
ncbi:MAG: hypothetical protein ACFUZC_06320 [Chthoniobacteraceae bacterium]